MSNAHTEINILYSTSSVSERFHEAFYGLVVNTIRSRQNGRHFPDDISKRSFLNENVWIPIDISLNLISKWPYTSIGSDDGLAPKRRQAIIWTKDGLVCLHIYAAFGLNELIKIVDKLLKMLRPLKSQPFPWAISNKSRLIGIHIKSFLSQFVIPGLHRAH